MKSFFLFTFLLISCTAFSQVKKGAILLEGSGSFTIEDSENQLNSLNIKNENRYTNLVLSPRIGFSTSENFVVGFGLAYQYFSSVGQSSSSNQKSTQKNNQILLSGYLRKYIQLNDKLYFTGTLSASGGLGKVKYTSESDFFPKQENTSNIYSANINISPGLAYFISNKWAVTASIGQLFANFEWYKPEDDNGTKNHSYRGGLNFQLNTFSLGVQYFLRNEAE